ncbi:hypothetical protein FRB99_001005 [Tulasnella sp. 403]|nr:hypothetical protein FRB99_001005 [Tulasnella sp. 403]
MHAALKIPEILLLVFDALDTEWLTSTSLVCIPWSPLALLTKWRKSQISLWQLMELLQESSTSTDDFLLFSQKVQKLTIDTELSTRQAEWIKETLQDRVFLPNLRNLSISSRCTTECTATLFLEGCPRIEGFTVDLPNIDEVNLLEGMLKALRNAATFRHLDLTTSLPSTPRSFTQLNHLQYLRIYDREATLDHAWWLMFSEYPDLRTLELSVQAIMHLSTTQPTVTTFPHLQFLTVYSRKPFLSSSLLYSTMPSLSELTVTHGLGGPEFCELMEYLKQHSPALQKLWVDVCDDAIFLMGDSIPSSLAGCQLKDLTLVGHADTSAVPRVGEPLLLEHWATLVENIESFKLFVSFRDGFIKEPFGVPIVVDETPVMVLEVTKKSTGLDINVIGCRRQRIGRRILREYGRVPAVSFETPNIEMTMMASETIERALRSALPGYQTVHIEMV